MRFYRTLCLKFLTTLCQLFNFLGLTGAPFVLRQADTIEATDNKMNLGSF